MVCDSLGGADVNDTAGIFLLQVKPLHKRLLRVARRYVATSEDARDLVQETLLRAWRDFTVDAERVRSDGWLFQILRNVAVDWYRLSRRRVSIEFVEDSELTELASSDLSEPLAKLPALNEEQFRDLLDEHVAAALDRLRPAFREIVILSVVGELSYKEIAAVLGRPVGTVMSGMARARRALRERLAEFAGSPRTTKGVLP